VSTADDPVLERIQRRVLWLSTLIVHHANRVRPNPDRIKVGGHQASSASVVSILTALYFDFLRGGDRIAIKPHASPAFHACQYLLGNLDASYLTRLRSFRGLQAYPSRTKDPDPVDFSTGSVGLGAVAPNYASLVHRYVSDRFGSDGERRRFVSLLGDAELDEGSIWETVAEPSLHGLDDLIWIVDLNRQSLDRVVPGIRVERFRGMFRANGWSVVDAKYGRKLRAAFEEADGSLLRDRIDELPNDEYQRILRADPGDARARICVDSAALARFLRPYSDAALMELLGDLGGHDLEVLRESLELADESPGPAVVFAYTVKGWGLPLAGDPLNHSALLSDAQIERLREALGIPEGSEFERFPDGSPEDVRCRAAKERLRSRGSPNRAGPGIPAELVTVPYPGAISSQRASALAMSQLPRTAPELAARVVTTSPDVATSTSLGGWIDRVGVYAPGDHADVFADAGPRLLRWDESPRGQHVELGISENNLFLALGAFGLAREWFSEPLIPIGTLYDPFIARGLDAFIYGLYSGSRFIVIATPSGVTLSPEGGAHQSIITPSIGLELPGLTYWEPCFALETEWILLDAMRRVMMAEGGSSSYLRLSTNPVEQALLPSDRDPRTLRREVLSGAYRLIDRRSDPGYHAGDNAVTLVASGAMVPVAAAVSDDLLEDEIFVDVVNVTSPSLLYQGYHESTRGSVSGFVDRPRPDRWRHEAFDAARPQPPVVCVLDGHPHTLAWLPAALGVRGVSLGVDGFGQSGSIEDLYHHFGIDQDAIATACVSLLGDRSDLAAG
jgi:pyruvate dehydrogenase E1 component